MDIDPARSTLDPAKIDAVLGHQGENAKGVYKVTVGLGLPPFPVGRNPAMLG